MVKLTNLLSNVRREWIPLKEFAHGLRRFSSLLHFEISHCKIGEIGERLEKISWKISFPFFGNLGNFHFFFAHAKLSE